LGFNLTNIRRRFAKKEKAARFVTSETGVVNATFSERLSSFGSFRASWYGCLFAAGIISNAGAEDCKVGEL